MKIVESPYKKIVFEIGYLQERMNMLDEDHIDEIYQLEQQCANIVRHNRKAKGLLYCENCGTDFAPTTSISKYFCGPCVDRNDEERLGWDIHGEIYGGGYYDEE